METTRLSSKGQVIIPKALRQLHHWEAGLELVVTDTAEGILLAPKAPFPPSVLSDTAGLLKHKVSPKSEEEISKALTEDMRRKWRDSN
ncbi:MAG TPA: AbrB/MazE/SpoVT family DNA-binding domain-containing protein [Pseudomonadales bacterium]|nr:AbrB/MazE/SpoVT family DNA-binding domain-containing protein [Pseudomonadales bacterium]